MDIKKSPYENSYGLFCIFMDHYQTISGPSEAEIKDKGSRFIAYAMPFSDEKELKTILENLKSQHPKARHYCFAYKFNDHSRTSDDGEPSGTAGKPIYNVILSKNLSNVLIVVVRYFGGTLLGVPGLINAYKIAAMSAIEKNTIERIYYYSRLKINFEYENIEPIMKIIKEHNLEIIEQNYSPNFIVLKIKQSICNEIIDKLENYRCFSFEIMD